MKTRPTELVEIDWVDSMRKTGWKQLSSFEAVESAMKHRTVGYVVYEPDTCLAVCQSFGPEREDPTVDGIMQIPKSAISSVRVIKAMISRKYR